MWLSAVDAGEKLIPKEHEKYRTMVGSLLYLACWTRPDISYAVSELSRFVSAPCAKHMEAAKHLIRYIRQTKDLSLQFSKQLSGKSNILTGYVDSDWAGCPDSRKSTSGYALMLNGAAISWKAKRQSVVALSTAEAEFVAASSMVQEVIYTRRILERLGFPQVQPTQIFEDNSTCTAWAEGSVGGSDRAKHMELRKHFVHEAVEQKVLSLVSIRSNQNAADLLTKPLARPLIQDLRKQLLGF